MNKIFSLLILFSTTNLWCMKTFNLNDVESTEKICSRTQKMAEMCNLKCAGSLSILQTCVRRCMMREEGRIQQFLVRKYTASCQSKPSTEDFNFEPNAQDRFQELLNTSRAYLAWECPSVLQCTNAKLSEHAKRMMVLQQAQYLQRQDIKEQLKTPLVAFDYVEQTQKRN